MDENFHDIDNLFQKATQRHSEIPSDGVWINLEKDLQKRNMGSVTRKYRKWKWTALALLLFSIGVGTYCFHITWRYNNAIKKFELGNITPDTTGNSPVIPGYSNHGQTHKKYDNRSIAITGKQKNIADGKHEVRSIDTAEAFKAATTEVKSDYNTTINNSHRNATDSAKNTVVYNNPVPKENTNNYNFKTIIASGANEREIKKLTNRTTKKPGTRAPGVAAGKDVFERNREDSAQGVVLPTLSTVDVEIADLRPALANSSLLLTDIHTTSLAALFYTDLMNHDKTFTANGYKLHARTKYRGVFTASVYYGRSKVSTLLSENHPDYKEDNYLQIKNHEKNRIANTIEFSLSRNIGRSWGIETGIGQTTYITDVSAKPLVARKDNNGNINYRISTSSGYAYYFIKALPRPALADSIHTLSSKSTVRYVSIPVGLLYYFRFQKFNIVPSLMTSVNFKTSGKIETIQSIEHSYLNDIQGLKSQYFEGSIRLKLNYYLNNAVGVSLMPYTRFGFSSVTEVNPVISHRSATGLAAGINVHF